MTFGCVGRIGAVQSALFRAARYTVALLDTATEQVEFITVPRE